MCEGGCAVRTERLGSGVAVHSPLHRHCTSEITNRSHLERDAPIRDNPTHRQMSRIRHTLIDHRGASYTPWVGWPREGNRASCCTS